MANRKPPKYQAILPLLTRKNGATMSEMMKALQSSDPHHAQNTMVSIRGAGYAVERRIGKDGTSRWFAKASTAKAKKQPPKMKAKSKQRTTVTKKPKTTPRPPVKKEPQPELVAAQAS